MEKKWYIVHTYSGYENKVKSTLEKTIANLNLQESISKVIIPEEDVIEVRRNKKRSQKRKFFPGYVFVEMVIDNQTYWIIRNTPGVSGFLGGVEPVPLPEEEKKNIENLISGQTTARPHLAVLFEKGETVRIIEGPFRHFIGVVEEVNEERAKIKVMVTIFGRPTPVELDFLQVEKI